MLINTSNKAIAEALWAAAQGDQPVEIMGVEFLATSFARSFSMDSMTVEFIGSELHKREWTGEGLPPVGVDCDFMWNYKRAGSEYVKARVLFHDGKSAIVRILDGDGKGSIKESRGGDCGAHPIFRPIRTPGQIAEEARKVQVDALARMMGASGSYERAAQHLYDCGVRLPEAK